MKKTKNILLAFLTITLVVVLSISATLAYLKSEDSDVNVMTMGNVKIAQHEFERVKDNGYYKIDTIDNQNSYVLKEFTQDKPLYPIVGDPMGGYDSIPVRLSQLGHNSRGSMDILKPKNVQDKFIVVENTGKSAAYVRTIVAFEAGSLDFDRWYNIINYTSHFTWKEKYLDEYVKIDGKNYYIVEFLYLGYEDIQHKDGVLTPGDYTYNSLAQVYMYSNATNEDVEKIDGNGNGKFDILVKSQAVQTKGFTDAKTALDTSFGETNSTNAAAWFTGMTYDKIVYNVDELNEAMPGHQRIILGDTINASYINNYGNDVSIIGNYQKMNIGDKDNYGFIARAGSKTIFNDVYIEAAGGAIGAYEGGKIIFNGNSVHVDTTSKSGRYNFYAEGENTEITINSGTFSFSTSSNNRRAYIYAGEGATVYVKGGTFGAASTRDKYNAGILGDGNVIITGGTFGFDPSAWVPSGYNTIKTGTTWKVEKA